jgi:EmrB/QacA subfamily drug resistance transporter
MANGTRSYKWMVLTIACIGSLMGPLDSTIVSVSLPTISESLNMDYAASVWIPTAYLVAVASLLLTIGRLSDIRGRKPIFVSGFCIFVLGSFLCSISWNGESMIAFRVLQGVGAAFIMATATAIVTDAFPPQERGKALGINTLFVYLGLSLGPPLGGILTEGLGWPSIFWVNIPIGILVIALASWKLKEPMREAKGKKFDISGAVTFAVGLVAFLVALTIGEDLGWLSPGILVLFALAILSLVAFALIQMRKGPDAMFDLQLITKNRLFAMANISTVLNYTAYFGVSFIISFYMQRVLGYSIFLTGMVLLSMPLTMSVLSPLSGWLSDKMGSQVLASGGMGLIGIGLVLMSTLDEGTSISLLIIYLLVLGIGMGLFSTPNTSAIMGCVTRDKLGVASGTVSTMRTVGQSLSLAIMGALVATAASTSVVSQLFTGQISSSDVVVTAEFLNGMRLAFEVSAVIALVGAVTSLARGSVREPLPPCVDEAPK